MKKTAYAVGVVVVAACSSSSPPSGIGTASDAALTFRMSFTTAAHVEQHHCQYVQLPKTR